MYKVKNKSARRAKEDDASIRLAKLQAKEDTLNRLVTAGKLDESEMAKFKAYRENYMILKKIGLNFNGKTYKGYREWADSIIEKYK